jgi:signal transduction histidine kinase
MSATISADQGQGAQRDLKAKYEKALRSYIQRAAEKDLVIAYELGRAAFAENVSILEIVSLHHVALAESLARNGKSSGSAKAGKLSGQFLSEVLSSYELGRRAYGDSVSGLHHLNEVLEQEVKRLAHTVHDEAGQLLVAAHLAIAEVMAQVTPDDRKRLEEVTGLLYQAEEHLREFSHELRPTMLDDLGVVPALRSLAEGVSKRRKLAIDIDSPFEGRLPPAVEIGLYRVVQEALTNVTRHSRAGHVKIVLKKTGKKVQCAVQDDGVGFDAAAVLSREGRKGLGLIGMQERLNVLKGTLRVASQPGQGAKLSIIIPLGE